MRHNSRLKCLGTSEQQRWTHPWHFAHLMELQPARSPQTSQESIFEILHFFPNNTCAPFALLPFTLISFPYTAFFHLPYLPITSFNDSPYKRKFSAYNNSINEPSIASSIKTSITIINKNSLKADLWCTPTFTENELYSSPSTETVVVLQPL